MASVISKNHFHYLQLSWNKIWILDGKTYVILDEYYRKIKIRNVALATESEIKMSSSKIINIKIKK